MKDIKKAESRYFPGYPRLVRTDVISELFGLSYGYLSQQRLNGEGLPFLRVSCRILYDIDACYEHCLSHGSEGGKKHQRPSTNPFSKKASRRKKRPPKEPELKLAEQG